MLTRYSVLLDGRLIGTVHLAGPGQRVERVRLGATPAYKRLARLFRRVANARTAYEEQALATPEAVLADEEGALGELSTLSLTLMGQDGVTATTTSVRLVSIAPPMLRVQW